MGRAGSCSGGQVMLHKTCLPVGLCSLPDGCLALGNPALEPTDSIVGLLTAFGEAHTSEFSPNLLLPLPLPLQ